MGKMVRSPETIQLIAQHFRQYADEAASVHYMDLMNRTAKVLEDLVASMKKSGEGTHAVTGA
jgi:hypothetical protein